MIYYGKSGKNITVEQHTEDVIKAAKTLLELYGDCFTEDEKELIILACKYHDAGKCNADFQYRIYRAMGLNIENEVKEYSKIYKKISNDSWYPHGYLSCAFIPKNICKRIKNKDKNDFAILVNAIIYHHARKHLPIQNEIYEIVKNDLEKRFSNYGINTLFTRYIWYGGNSHPTDKLWVKYAVIKGILNRADYYASRENIDYPMEISGICNCENLGEKIKRILIEDYGNLRDVQQYMYDKRESNIVVIASTGSGKTEGAFLWADNAKTFYTLPLQVSINAIYDRIIDKYGFDKSKISLLHSNAITHLIEKEENAFSKYETAKNLSYPVTICTIDQLFTFVYKYLGSEMLLATLKHSKVIIDEIQAYSPQVIGKLIYGLKLINSAGGKFAIMTATMPPIINYFMKQNGINFEIKEFPLKAKRHKIEYRETEFNYDEIIEQSEHKKVLVICNTVKRAQVVYEQLSKKCMVYLLHSRYINEHKKMIEDKIQKFSNGNEYGIWVTTQIVEASLNIDFDVLHTDMCTADSLLQRMGRCYRNRKKDYASDEANIIIYDTSYLNREKKLNQNGNGYGTIYNDFLYDRSVEFLQQYAGSIFTEEDKSEYINKVYDTEELINADSDFYKKIKEYIKLCEDAFPREYSQTEAKEKFRDIVSYTLIPDDIYSKLLNNGILDYIENTISGSDLLEREKAKNKLKRIFIKLICSHRSHNIHMF